MVLFPHGAVDADAAGAYEEDGEEGYEIEIGLFVDHPAGHRHMPPMSPEFCDTHADDGYQRGKTGEEAECDQEAAKQLREDNEGQGDAMSEVEGVGEDILKMAEVPEFIDTIVKAEDETEGNPQRQKGDVEGAFTVCGREEFFHIRLRF